MKHIIKTIPNRLCGATTHDVDGDKIHVWEADRDRVPLYVIGHTYGAVCAIFARSEQDALDTAADADLLDCFRADPDDDIHTDDCGEQHNSAGVVTGLGNRGDPYNLDDCWIQRAAPLFEQSAALIYAVGYGNGVGSEVLE